MCYYSICILKKENKKDMTFPGALSGVKRIFLAFMIILISTLVMNISTIINEIGNLVDSYSMRTAGILGSMISFFVGGLFVIGATILEILGIFNARSDESGSRFLLVALIAAIVNVPVSIINTFYDIAKIPMAVATNVLAIVTVVFTVLGIRGFAKKLGDEMLTRRACFTWILLAILRAFSTVVALVTPSPEENTPHETLVFIFIMYTVYTVLITAYYVIYVLFLSRAKKMLKPKESGSKFTSSGPKYYNPAED